MRIAPLTLLLAALPLLPQEAESRPAVPSATQAPSQPLPAAAAASSPEPVPVPAPAPKPATKVTKLDSGLLDPSWFGDGVTLAKGDVIDYYWMKPGLSLKGHSVKVGEWEPAAWLGPKRDDRDRTTVETLMDSFPGTIKRSLEKASIAETKFSRSEGEWLLVGRFVDCNAKSVAAKAFTPYFAGTENITWDLKLVDPKSGEVLLAAHHRIISGAFSTIERKLAKWVDEFAEFLAARANR